MKQWKRTHHFPPILRLSVIWSPHPWQKLYGHSAALDVFDAIFTTLGWFQAACLIRVPTEVIKTRMQTLTYGTLGQSSLSAAKLLLSNDGWRGFYRGFGSTIMREVCIGSRNTSCEWLWGQFLIFALQIPFTSIQFPLYELLKLQLSRRLNRKPLYAREAAICGSIAGGTAGALTTPLDVLKTRVMLDLRVSIHSHYFSMGFMTLHSGPIQRKNTFLTN